MSGSSHVFIIVSPRPRTGKTLLARLVAEYYQSNARPIGQTETRPVVGYDLSPYEPGLSAFLPNITTQSTLEDTRGQIALFDQLVLDDDKTKVVDLSHMVLEKFFTLAWDIDFAQEAASRGVSAVVMYVGDHSPITVETYRILREKFPALTFMPVFNDAIVRGPEIRRQFQPSPGTPVPLQIPQLSSHLRVQVDRRPFSFREFRATPPTYTPEPLREEMASFMKRVFRQLREAELSNLMHKLTSSLGPLGHLAPMLRANASTDATDTLVE
jgi:hypothetical protein